MCSAASDCGNPGVPDNGQVSLSAGTTLGSTATYLCDVGHDLIGATVRKCRTDGQWSNSVPICMTGQGANEISHPCTKFEGVNAAFSLQMCAIYILGISHPHGPK